MKRHVAYLAIAAVAAVGFSGTAFAAGQIHTGGQAGAYNSTFCPPFPEALKWEQFPGYTCAPSAGTIENIQDVIATPTDLGFVQQDVFLAETANPDADITSSLKGAKLSDKVQIIPLTAGQIACEGLWMVTKNPRLTNYGDITARARRVPFILPPEKSGSVATFNFLKSIDPTGLGKASTVQYANDTASMINQVAASPNGDVGFFVQFADPENANIKLLIEKGLTVIPVVSSEVVNAKVDGHEVYQVQQFDFTNGGFFKSANQATTACTPVQVITGTPAAFGTDQGAMDDQKDMIKTVQGISPDSLLPKEPRFAKLIKAARRVTGSTLDDLLAGVKQAKDAAAKELQN